MIKVKHLMDDVEPDDGERIWVEPIGLTRDLQEWCGVHHVATGLGPPLDVWLWFERHPKDYHLFRSFYHDHLAHRRDRAGLPALAALSLHSNLTLLHQGRNPCENSAAALSEYFEAIGARVAPRA